MKHLLTAMLLAFICQSIHAADFKIGEAKYEILSGTTVQLKDYKKATGDVVIPEKVTDPKKGTEYTVTIIAKEAFKKAPLTSVSLPESVTSIGEGVFKECPNLKSVKYPKSLSFIPAYSFQKCSELNSFDLDGIETIGREAFLGTGLKAIEIPSAVKEIGLEAFASCPNLKKVQIDEGLVPINFAAGVFHDTPVKHVIQLRDINYDNEGYYADYKLHTANDELSKYWIGPKVTMFEQDKPLSQLVKADTPEQRKELLNKMEKRREKDRFLRDCPNADIIFIDEDASDQVINVYGSMRGKSIIETAEEYYNIKRDPYRSEDRDFSEYMKNRWAPYYGGLPKHWVYFGAEETEDGLSIRGRNALTFLQGLEKGLYIKDKKRVLKQLEKFTYVAINDPENLYREYRDLNAWEMVRFNSEISNVVRVLCDSVYFVKPTLTKAEIDNVAGFINNYFMSIGAEYGIPNCRIKDLASYPDLKRDLESGRHKADYERILKACDRYLQYVENPQDEDYMMAVQLVALCGAGRWKDASNYYPKFHRVYTDNGRLSKDLPEEIKFIKTAINQHGYKTVDPVYPKKGSAKASSKNSKSGNAELVEFFMKEAIDAGVEHYKKKKAKKEARELFYESMGLDKKGRPIKKKK